MLEGEIKVGSVVSAEDHSFEVKDVYYTTKVSEKRGRVTTSMQEGSYMVVKLSFTNLDTEAFERWHSDRVENMTLTYNGKYTYEGEPWTVDDIVPLDTKNLYIVYTVPEQLKKNTDKSVVAEFTIDDEYYVVNICKGAIATNKTTAASAALDTQVAKGETRSDGENFSFTVQDTYYTTKVSEKRGRVTTSMREGSYMVVKLSFSNLGTEAFERWRSDRVDNMILTYNGKYDYEGETWTVDDIVPLDTQNLYIVYTVPEQLKDNTDKSVVAKFTIDGKSFAVTICKGTVAAQSTVAAPSSLNKQVALGESRSNGESFRFTVQDIYYTTKVSEKRGNVTTSMQEGSYMVVKLSFTNLAAEAIDDWHTNRAEEIILTYDNKYEYKGQTWAVDDIVPLDTQNLYIVYTVPELLKNNTNKPVVAEFTIDGQPFVVDLSNAKIRN